MLEDYLNSVKERDSQGIPPLPLDAEQTSGLIELIKDASKNDKNLLELLTERVPAGVDDAAYVKAAFLSDIANKKISCELISPKEATFYLGTMLGGYNVEPLISLIDDPECGEEAVKALSNTLLVFDAFNDIAEKSKSSENAAKILNSWAEAEWFLSKPEVPEKIDTIIFKVPGETNTDDLSPAPDAWSRPDIPLHALSMYKMPRKGLSKEPLKEIEALKEKGLPVTLVGDVMGTGSSRKVSDLRLNFVISFPFSSSISPLAGKIETISPILRFSTSASKTKVPESSIVLKNIGATFSPIQIPPVFLFGI